MFFIFVKKYDNRIKVLFVVFVTIFMVLIVRLIRLQLFPSDEVLETGDICQTEKVNDTKFNIVDCNGKSVLKFSKKYVLVIDKKPFSLNNYEETLQDLLTLNFIMQGECTDFSFESIMKSQGKSYYNITKDAFDKINELKNVKGIYTYEYDEVNKNDAWSVDGMITNMPDEYKISEGSFDEELNDYIKGNKEVRRNFYLDEKSLYTKKKEVEIDDNNKIRLTIDEDIQEKIKETLARDEFSNYENVAVILMESNTGKVKAMVQKDESEANLNLCIEGMGYEPGSVYKLITLGAALEEGEVSLNDIFTCKGRICKEGSHGRLTVRQALVKSCNDIFADIGEKVGYEKLMSYSERLGLFSPILNMKGESRNEAEGVRPEKKSGMTNISIGQCLTVTPIQVVGFTNAIVNNGVYVKPHIIEDILDSEGNIYKELSVKENRVFSTTTSKLIKGAMVDVVKKGTGKNAQVDGITIGGKTGSATGSNNKTHGWFSGYFTYKNKTYTMTVFVPNIVGKDKEGEDLGGGSTAAPIFREVVKTIINS